MLKARKTWAKIYIGDSIEYDVKLSQVKVTIVKRKKIRVKGFTVNHSQKNHWHGQQVCGAIKRILDTKFWKPILNPSQKAPLILIFKRETSYTHY